MLITEHLKTLSETLEDQDQLLKNFLDRKLTLEEFQAELEVAQHHCWPMAHHYFLSCLKQKVDQMERPDKALFVECLAKQTAAFYQQQASDAKTKVAFEEDVKVIVAACSQRTVKNEVLINFVEFYSRVVSQEDFIAGKNSLIKKLQEKRRQPKNFNIRTLITDIKSISSNVYQATVIRNTSSTISQSTTVAASLMLGLLAFSRFGVARAENQLSIADETTDVDTDSVFSNTSSYIRTVGPQINSLTRLAAPNLQRTEEVIIKKTNFFELKAQAETSLLDGKFEEALSFAKRAHQIQPKNLSVCTLLIISEYEDNQAAGPSMAARDCIRMVVSSKPKTSLEFYGRSISLAQGTQMTRDIMEQSIDDLVQARKLWPYPNFDEKFPQSKHFLKNAGLSVARHLSGAVRHLSSEQEQFEVCKKIIETGLYDKTDFKRLLASWDKLNMPNKNSVALEWGKEFLDEYGEDDKFGLVYLAKINFLMGNQDKCNEYMQKLGPILEVDIHELHSYYGEMIFLWSKNHYYQDGRFKHLEYDQLRRNYEDWRRLVHQDFYPEKDNILNEVGASDAQRWQQLVQTTNEKIREVNAGYADKRAERAQEQQKLITILTLFYGVAVFGFIWLFSVGVRSANYKVGEKHRKSKKTLKDITTISSVVTDAQWILDIKNYTAILSVGSLKSINENIEEAAVAELKRLLSAELMVKLLPSSDSKSIRVSLEGCKELDCQIIAKRYEDFIAKLTLDHKNAAEKKQRAEQKQLQQERLATEKRVLHSKYKEISSALTGFKLAHDQMKPVVRLANLDDYIKNAKRCVDETEGETNISVKTLQNQIIAKVKVLTGLVATVKEHISSVEKAGNLSDFEQSLQALRQKIDRQDSMSGLEELRKEFIGCQSSINARKKLLQACDDSYQKVINAQQELHGLVKNKNDLMKEQARKKNTESKVSTTETPEEKAARLERLRLEKEARKKQEQHDAETRKRGKGKAKERDGDQEQHPPKRTFTIQELEAQQRELPENPRLTVAIHKLDLLSNILQRHEEFSKAGTVDLFEVCQNFNFDNAQIRSAKELYGFLTMAGLLGSLMKSADALASLFKENKLLLLSNEKSYQTLRAVRNLIMHEVFLDKKDFSSVITFAKNCFEGLRQLTDALHRNDSAFVKTYSMKIDIGQLPRLEITEKNEILEQIISLIEMLSVFDKVAEKIADKGWESYDPNLELVGASAYYKAGFLHEAQRFCIARLGELFSKLRRGHNSSYTFMTQQLQRILGEDCQFIRDYNNGARTYKVTAYEMCRYTQGHQRFEELSSELHADLEGDQNDDIFILEDVSAPKLYHEMRLITKKLAENHYLFSAAKDSNEKPTAATNFFGGRLQQLSGSSSSSNSAIRQTL